MLITSLRNYLLACLPLLALAACCGSGNDLQDRLDLADPAVRFVHASPIAPDLTLYRADVAQSDATDAMSGGASVTARRACAAQPAPYTGMAAPWITFASSLHRNSTTRAMSSGRGQRAKSAAGIARRLATLSMMLGSTELTRTPLPARSAARLSISASTAAFDAA